MLDAGQNILIEPELLSYYVSNNGTVSRNNVDLFDEWNSLDLYNLGKPDNDKLILHYYLKQFWKCKYRNFNGWYRT